MASGVAFFSDFPRNCLSFQLRFTTFPGHHQLIALLKETRGGSAVASEIGIQLWTMKALDPDFVT